MHSFLLLATLLTPALAGDRCPTVDPSACEQGSWQHHDVPFTPAPPHRGGTSADRNRSDAATRWWWTPSHPDCHWGAGASRQSMCKTLSSLGMRRILIVGDSLQTQLAESLLGLLDAKPLSPAGGSEVIVCPDGFNFTVTFRRNNLLLPTPVRRCDATPAEREQILAEFKAEGDAAG